MRMLLFKMLDSILGTFVIDTHPVDDGLVIHYPEQSRLRVASLGERGQ